MRRPVLLPALLAMTLLPLSAASLPAYAQTADDGVRFQIEKTKYGFVRLDRQTGAMTFCREGDELLVCDPVATAKPAVENEVATLKASVDAFAARLNAAEASLKQSAALAKEQADRLKAAEDALAEARKTIDGLKSAAIAPLATGETEKGIEGGEVITGDTELDASLSKMAKVMHWFVDVTRKLDAEQGLPQ